MRKIARPTHRVGRAMPTRACENDRVPQKVVDQVVVKVAARKEEGKRVRPLRSLGDGEMSRLRLHYSNAALFLHNAIAGHGFGV